MAASPSVIAAMTPIPVIELPIKASLDGLDSLPNNCSDASPGIPVATVAINGALNAGILCAQMIATGDSEVYNKTVEYKENLKKKIVNANKELKSEKFKFRTN